MDSTILLPAAASIGFVHTIMGPDHYLPFIMIARARKWSFRKTALITILCGTGHVLGSVVLGILGIALGIAVGSLETVETFRETLASYLLVGFGVAYLAWGLRVGLRASEHSHDHRHDDDYHEHAHSHLGSHVHLHGSAESVTPWALFVIFVLGPCEPLIPILMYPAAEGNWWNLTLVVVVFGIITIATMVAIVTLALRGAVRVHLGPLEKYGHALAGLIIALSGLALLLVG